jgi:hypothetical protein
MVNILHQKRIWQEFFCQGLLVEYGGMIEVWVECKAKMVGIASFKDI